MAGQYLYDNTQEGRLDNNTGDVYADIRHDFEPSGMAIFRFFAFRSNDGDFNDVDVLIGSDTEPCITFNRTVSLGEDTAVSIGVDREAGLMYFQVADERQSCDIQTSHFQPRGMNMGLRLNSESGGGGGRVVRC